MPTEQEANHSEANTASYPHAPPVKLASAESAVLRPLCLAEVFTRATDTDAPGSTHNLYWREKVGSRFFFIGVLRYYKGLHILLQAARYVSFPVVIAGQVRSSGN